MSVLETPRIIFGGEVSWDPIVTNNYQNEYNEATSLPQMDFNETVEQFRADAISADAVINNGNWNPQGTHRSNFYNAYVSGVDLGSGIERKDPFVSSAAAFQGMLVDLEPYGAFTSQLFFDQISFGIEGGCRILAARKYRFTARYINFFRLPRSVYGFAASVASVVWQTSFEKAGLTIDAYDSPALTALKAALDDPGVLGLTVRFNVYSTHYYGAENSSDIPPLEQQLVDNLAAGGFQPNPARSTMVGVIGLWRENEPAQEPGDRVMLAAQQGPPKFVASAYARLETGNAPLDGKNILTIDMSNSISETDLQQTKQDLGPLTVSAVDSGGNQTELGTIDYSQYNRDAYRDSAGIVTLQLSDLQAKAAAGGTLQMTGGGSGSGSTTYLTEQALRAIPCDPNLYVNLGDPDSTTDVLVLNKGVPAGSGITVAMELNSPSVVQSTTAVTGSDSIATFTVLSSEGQQGQVQGFVLQPDPDGSAEAININPQATTYMYIRMLADPGPFQGAVPPAATWDNVYDFCLANWNAMAPCMDNWLDLKSETEVKAYASIIKKLTDPNNFESYRFMPVTRDMTPGERDLLYRFLDGDQAKSVKLEAAPQEEPATPAELSRQMRRAK
ncbi:MAG TPA: hypothetical protein VGO50_08780 [Pyrinomonadaceae bacterium]|jgi:hypothetical protein|nr:hypothetical protein [Pyrinomonadaceae bacterium]